MNEHEALERIKEMVEPKVVKYEGDVVVSPSYLDIYNIACLGLGEVGDARDCSVTSRDSSEESCQSN